MRRFIPVFAAMATLAIAGVAQAQSLSLPIDQAERIALRGAARDVIIGNPAIADVTVVDERNLVITGKGYGSTNLIVLDAAGRTLVNRQILVIADEGRVSFYRGSAISSYSCSPRCERTGTTDGGGQSAPVQPANGDQ